MGLPSDRVRALLEWSGPRQSRRSRRRVVKVHGLLRTGTNYVSALLGENLDVQVLGPEKGGWKHGPIDMAEGVTTVVVVKSPGHLVGVLLQVGADKGTHRSPHPDRVRPRRPCRILD